MRLRRHRRTLVVWSAPVGPVSRYGIAVSRYGIPGFTRASRRRRIRRGIRTGWLLAAIGMIWLGRVVRTRWRPLVAGGILTAVSVTVRGGAGAVLLLPGAWFLVVALLASPSSLPASERCSELRRELATYSTPAQRRDLEATLDLYPDDITCELRDILTGQGKLARRAGLWAPRVLTDREDRFAVH